MNYEDILSIDNAHGEINLVQLSDEEVLKKIGSKLKEIRLEKNVKQKELSEKSGLSMFSISQMEMGHNTSVQSLVQVLRALDRMDMIAPLLSPEGEENKMYGRQRVSKVHSTGSATVPFPNHHNVRSYTLPEQEEYGMAAEEIHRNR